MPHSVAHIITALDTGGAETMLLNVLAHTDRERWAPTVVSLRDRGTLSREIEQLGIPVTTLGLGQGWPRPAAGWRVRRHLRERGPGVLLGWMYHGNVAAWVARVALAERRPLVWNIQHTPDDLPAEKSVTAAVIHLGAMLSRRPARIIYSSHRSAELHARLGYDAAKAVVIPNGFDTEQFAPSPAGRAAWRARLGVGKDTVVIGRIGRYHPMKDYAGFLAAAAELRRDRADVHCVLAGRGLDGQNRELVAVIRRLGLATVVSLLGEVRPVHELTAALDIGCSSSAFGEAFPGVVAEAMACGVPCVTTNVGDSASIVGDVGAVVPPRDPSALAAALRSLVDAGPEGRRRLGERARARIREHFSIRHVAKMYEAVLEEAAVAPAAVDTAGAQLA